MPPQSADGRCVTIAFGPFRPADESSIKRLDGVFDYDADTIEPDRTSHDSHIITRAKGPTA
jgi:hypothetical protein